LFGKVVSDWVTDRTNRGWGVTQHKSMLSFARTHVIPELGRIRCDRERADDFNRLLAASSKEG